MKPPGSDRRGPLGKGTASSVMQAGEAKTSLAYETPVVVDGALARLVHTDADLAAAFEAGRQYGRTEGLRAKADDLAREHLLAQSDEWRRWSAAVARTKGPGWAWLIDQQAAGDEA